MLMGFISDMLLTLLIQNALRTSLAQKEENVIEASPF